MKNYKSVFLRIFAVMMFVLLIGLCGCVDKTVTSVQSMRLSMSSYHSGETVYEISEKDGDIELCRYRVEYSGHNYSYVLEVSDVCDTEEFIELMNTCRVPRWNGFNRDSLSVMDGTSFHFSATVNDGQTIEAEGYSKFPKGYSEFVVGLEDILEDGEVHSTEAYE